MDFSERFREWSLKTDFVSSDEKRHLHPDAEPDVWQRGARLGSGGFGDVFKEICVDGPRKHQTRAVKQIRKSPDNMRLVQRELGVLVDFSTDNNKHDSRDNFVRFLGWFSDNVHLYIAMELVPFGDLQSHISTHPSSERDTAVIIGQVGRALQYMHERNYVHRDLKPANILVARPGPDWHVKLTDFGISKNIDNTKLQTQVGTEAYMAPELFDRNDGKINITSAVDVWSLGAVAFCIRTGKAPFANTYELCRFSSGTTRFPTQPLMRSSTEFFDFILGLMEKSPAGRLTISEALDHEWVSGVFGSSTRSETVLPARNEDEWEAPASAMWNTGVPPASQPSLRLSQRTSEDTIRPVSTSSRSLPVVNGNSHYRYENAVPQKLETPATATRLPSPRREHQKSEGLNAGTAFRHPSPSSPANPTATSTRPLSPISETLRREARNKLETRPSWTSYLDGLYDARLKFKPRWDSPGWLSGGHEVMVKVPYFDGNIRGLNSVMALVGLRANITTIPLQLRQTLVSSGWDAAADTGFARLDPSATNYIFDTDGQEYQKIADDLERLALARAFSLEFNAFADPAPIIEFPIVPFVTMPFITGNNRDWFFLEDHNYSMSAKDLYNDTHGFANSSQDKWNIAAQAFSHFTFERSKGQILVCCLAGDRGLFRIPYIHAVAPECRDMPRNRGMNGFIDFFVSHHCNSICRRLDLKSTGNGLQNDSLQFRQNWPPHGSITSCCNLLCGRSVHDANPRDSGILAWCYQCKKHLEASEGSRRCPGPGREHGFITNDFFYKVQGHAVPTTCYEHCGPEVLEVRNYDNP